jgi:Domain of unknown function (DUF4126)
MESIALIACGWSSGINAYLTVLLLGLAGRLDLAETPESLQHPWVLPGATILFATEFVVDKVPLVDSAWDVAHTAIRPAVGAAVGAAIAGAELGRPAAALAAAGLALTGHATKATTRLAINASPEPFTNIVASVAEDSLVMTLVVLAIAHPRLAAALAIIALVLGVLLALVLLRLVRRGWRSLRSRARLARAERRG